MGGHQRPPREEEPVKNICLPALAALLASGCLLNPALHRKGAFAADDWETWTGWNDTHGSYSLEKGVLTYALSARQDDAKDMPFDGLNPGLIISRPVPGPNWRVEVKARAKLPGGAPKSVAFGVWTGPEYGRPSTGSPGASLLLARYSGGGGHEDLALSVSAPPDRTSPVAVPQAAKALRFERREGRYLVQYSLDGVKFITALSFDAGAEPPDRMTKFMIAGRCEGEPRGGRTDFTSIRINGREVLE
jgi:hypothetical protein